MIDYERFKALLPVGATPSHEIFDRVLGHINHGRSFLRLFVLGDQLSLHIWGGSEELWSDELEIRDLVERLECLKAFASLIPQLDLVLTPTGFGVVSNQNVAPASRDRVEALTNSVNRLSLDCLTELLSRIEKHPLWHLREWICRGVLWTPADFMKLSNPPRNLDEWSATVDRARDAAGAIEERLGKEMAEAIFQMMLRRNNEKPMLTESRLVGYARAAVVAVMEGTDPDRRRALSNLERYAIRHVDDWPEFAESPEYKAHLIEPYENEKNSPGYFFG